MNTQIDFISEEEEANLKVALDLFHTFATDDDFTAAMVQYLAGGITAEDLIDEIDSQADLYKSVLKN